MKIRTLQYHITQGVRGLWKNGLMSLASIAIVSACVFILIISLCIAVNIDYALEQIENQIGITLFMGEEATEAQIATLEEKIKKMPHVTQVKYATAENALEEAEGMWGKIGALNGLKGDNPFPRSLSISVDDIKYQRAFIAEMQKLQYDFENELVNGEPTQTDVTTQVTTGVKSPDESNIDALPVLDENGNIVGGAVEKSSSEIAIGQAGYQYRGIEKIRHALDVVETLTAVNTVIRIGSLILIAIMCVIAIGIIMNTIKLTVFIRKNEIGIMKYVGATDWFIRWPFIIEGILIGLIGAVIPCILCWGGYDELIAQYNQQNVPLIRNMIEFKSSGEIYPIIFPVSLVLGGMLGAIGSINSIRKHLNV